MAAGYAVCCEYCAVTGYSSFYNVYNAFERRKTMINKINLPYSLDALEPYYSKETLLIHYNTLYTGYVDKTNQTEEKLKQARANNDFSNIKCLEKELSFQGSGAILHQLFFENMGPALPTSPNTKLMEQIIVK